MLGESWNKVTHESSSHFELFYYNSTLAEVLAAGVTDQLLEADAGVMPSSFSILSLLHSFLSMLCSLALA